jgi:cation transport protein ChaC
MSTDTSETNKNLDFFDRHESLWLFAYGSIIFKVDFDYIDKRPASIDHFSRRFWQGSHDHRGTVEAPGRVVTLVPDINAQCLGMAYRITPAVFHHLDDREKNGYLRQQTALRFDDDSEEVGLIYIADDSNAAFLGPASDADIAAQIARSHGPSGSNRSYLLNLANALRQLGSDDQHVFTLERLVLAL